MRQDTITAPLHRRRHHRAERSPRYTRWIVLASATLMIAGTTSAAQADTGVSSVRDTFGRTVKSGLGTTSSGVKYESKASKTAKLSVQNHQGVAKMTTHAAAFQASVPRANIADTAVRSTFSMTSLPKAGGVYYGVLARKTDDSYYRTTARVGSDRKVTLTITRFNGSKHTQLTRTIALPWRYSSKLKFNLELNVTGSKTVNLQARAWPAGAAVPSWQLAANDNASNRLAGKGTPGISGYLSAKSNPTTIEFDNFSALPTAPTPAPAPIPAPTPTPTTPAPTTPAPTTPAPTTPAPTTPAPTTPAPTTPAPTTPAPTTPTPTTPAPGNPSGTGVPAGTKLTVHDGDLTVTTAGTVVDSLDIRGYLRIKAANVTVKNTIVRGRDGLGNTSMALVQNSSPGVVIQDSELVAQFPTYYIDGFVGSNATFTRVNIHGVVDSIKLIGDNVVVQDSWLHDNLYYAAVPSGGDTHNDNIQIGVGQNITIRNNTMTGTRNAVLMVTQDRGPVGNLTFSNNRVDNGACSINLAEKSYGPMQGLRFSDNVFGTGQTISRCALIAKETTVKLLTLTNNMFTDGKAMTPTRG